VSQLKNILVETDLPGLPLNAVPKGQRGWIYREAVTGWARMLMADEILQVGLRRDHLLIDDGRIGITRWAGLGGHVPCHGD